MMQSNLIANKKSRRGGITNPVKKFFQ